MPAKATSAGPRITLEVDGANVGTLKKFSGLGAQADIALISANPAEPAKKNVSSFQWTPGRATVGLGMGKGLYGWLRSSMTGGSTAGGGVFRSADFNGKVKFTLSFSDALITEFTVPRLDATSKEAGFFDIAFQADRVVWASGKGEVFTPGVLRKAKTWVLANFKIAIGSLPCAGVVAVESFTWRAGVQTDTVGMQRPGELHRAKVTVPDLKLSISAADYPAWAEAARQWFVEGKRLESDEMAGRITLLGSNLVDELAFIDLSNVGFKSFAHPEAVTAGGQVERFTVELYVERMQLGIKDLDG